MPRFAEQCAFTRTEEYGPNIARPVGAGEVDLCKVTVPSGYYGSFSIIQGLNTNAAILTRVIPGLTWLIYGSDLRGANPKPVNVGPGADSQAQRWTFDDGRPAIRNVLVLPATTLILRANFDPATAPASILGLSGALVGWTWKGETMTEEILASLVSRP